MGTRADAQYQAALRVAEDPGASPEERAEMMMEAASGLLRGPASTRRLRDAVSLYERALATVPAGARLLRARIRSRLGAALRALPDGGGKELERARRCFEGALEALTDLGGAEEMAEAELNLGLCLQTLAGHGKARVERAIDCYRRALRVFDRERFPLEYSILHGHLAIAYLSIPAGGERGSERRAQALRSFEEVLKLADGEDRSADDAAIRDDPGKASHCAAGGGSAADDQRALAAFREALRVNSRQDAPLEYANIIISMAGVLRRLVPTPGCAGAADPLLAAHRLYGEAGEIFRQQALHEQAEKVAGLLVEVVREIERVAHADANGSVH